MNLNQLLTTQQVDYERDLENPLAGLDTCPFDSPTPVELHDDIQPPCNYCHAHGQCGCIDRGSPHGHTHARRGW